MKKVSAVDWLIDSYFGGLGMVTPNFRKFIEQAKEMEKQQIIDAKNSWLEDDLDGDEYYNENFKEQ
jgi:hypothetical protein